MYAVKNDVQFEIERLRSLFNELVECAEGERPKFQIEHGLSDEWMFEGKHAKYPIGQVIEIDENRLEACVTRVNNETRNLMKTIRRRW